MKPRKWWLMNNRHLFPKVLEVKVKVTVRMVHAKAQTWDKVTVSWLCPHPMQGWGALWGLPWEDITPCLRLYPRDPPPPKGRVSEHHCGGGGLNT